MCVDIYIFGKVDSNRGDLAYMQHEWCALKPALNLSKKVKKNGIETKQTPLPGSMNLFPKSGVKYLSLSTFLKADKPINAKITYFD